MHGVRKVAIVTGGAGGIGRFIASRMARDGAAVVVADLADTGAEDFAQTLKEKYGAASALSVDVSDAASVGEMYRSVQQQFGAVDILVHCAGVARHGPLIDLPLGEWTQLIAVNTTGTFLCLQGAAQLMVPLGRGRLITIATGAAMTGLAGRGGYGASKAPQIALTRSFAAELGVAGITVNAIAPGAIDTEMARKLRTPKNLELWSQHLAIKRYGQPSEVASAVAFLASDEAAYITGQVLTVDGGFTSCIDIADGKWLATTPADHQ